MRLRGGDFCDEELHLADATDRTLTRSAPGIDAGRRQQAEMAFRLRGLGMRPIRNMAKAAELAAKVIARPDIATLDHAWTIGGLMPQDALINAHATRVREATQLFQTALDAE